MLKKTLLNTLKKHLVLCLLLLVAILCITLLSLAPAYILQGLIDNVIINKGNSQANGLLTYALIYFGALAFVGIFELLKQLLLVTIGQYIIKDIRICLADKLSVIDALYFNSADAGQMTSIFVNDVDAISSIFTDGLISMVIDLLKIVGIIISMFIFSYVLGIVAIVVIPIIYLISHMFKSRMFNAQLQNKILIGKANHHIEQSVKTKQIIKVFSLEGYMAVKYNALLVDNYKALSKANFYDSIYSPIIKVLAAVIIAAIISLSGVNLALVGISIGELAGAVALVESLFAPVENIGMELQSLQSAMSGIKRVSDFLEQKDERLKSDVSLKQILDGGTIQIRFEHLSFSYDSKTQVLSDLNIQIDTGEKVTIVGRTGVGKTTLFKLVLGLIGGEGKVTLNGVDVYSIQDCLKPQLFGFVEQSFSYISGSIKDNITLYNDKLTDTMVDDALDFVLLGGVIDSLPNGINTEFSPSLFSQGQLQLLSIARAIVYNPPILLLDEITANLDAATETQILNILQRATDNRTILAISHRQSSIIDSDKIVTLEDGKIKSIKCK